MLTISNLRINQLRRGVAASLLAIREELSLALFAAVRDETCASWGRPQRYEQLEEWGRSQLLTAVDLFIKSVQTGDLLYRELFVGWVHSRLAADLSTEGTPQDYNPGKAVELARDRWAQLLKTRVHDAAIEILSNDLEKAASVLSTQPLKRLRILFIGDCIQFEVITALAGPCAQAQIRIEPTLLNERLQPALRNRLRGLNPNGFDLVFFSPFSHGYLPQYEHLLKPNARLLSKSKVSEGVRAMLEEIFATVAMLEGQFDCPIYVHNSAGTVQSFGAVRGLAKSLISHSARKRARELINNGLLQGRFNEDRVRLLDESGLRDRISDWRLGRTYLNSHAFHPTRLGIELGRSLYFEVVYVTAFLANRKVVVSDLDNTLWEGIIGEGPVTHHLDRQNLLKKLRNSGILLSINSKNDPANVKWFGSPLQPDDFVSPQINWNSKVSNMGVISDELNLKVKDFVFIDDRPDERERVQKAFPEILVLDATDPWTWERLKHWQKTLSSQPEEDRTKLYHERVTREEFVRGLSQVAVHAEDETAALAALEICVKIRSADSSNLKRAAELINRTNQFNVAASRTTVRELEEGLGTEHLIITAEASDKFGSMGTVGIMRLDWSQDGVEIPVFVLSCRAFGFGIEYALLSAVKKLVPADFRIVGHYRENKLNEPGRKLYPTSGLNWDGTNWIGTAGQLPSDPRWLVIDSTALVGPFGPINTRCEEQNGTKQEVKPVAHN